MYIKGGFRIELERTRVFVIRREVVIHTSGKIYHFSGWFFAVFYTVMYLVIFPVNKCGTFDFVSPSQWNKLGLNSYILSPLSLKNGGTSTGVYYRFRHPHN